jgi:hypothetical protein
MVKKNNIQSVTKIYSIDNTFKSYSVVLISDNTLNISVPIDTANTDYQEIQQWIADGGTVIDNGA